MGYLSEALQRYYKKGGKQITFKGNISLSSLALTMWEHLGYTSIDASVVSRVIKGERLFTSEQLEAFCFVLQLQGKEKKHLFNLLARDYFKKNTIDIFSTSPHEIIETFYPLASKTVELFYEGKSEDVIKHHEIVQLIYKQLLSHKLSALQKKQITDIYGYSLYLRERSIAGFYSYTSASRSLSLASKQLISLSKEYSLKNLSLYGEVLMGDIYYMLGFNKKLPVKNTYFQKAIDHGQYAYSHFFHDHPEKLAALRIISASAFYIPDEKILRFAENELKVLLSRQGVHSINTIHLSRVITKGKVIFADKNPFSLENDISQLFEKEELKNYFELSSIKTRLETFDLLKIKDKNIILPLAQRGLALTEKGSFPRHKRFFEEQNKLFI